MQCPQCGLTNPVSNENCSSCSFDLRSKPISSESVGAHPVPPPDVVDSDIQQSVTNGAAGPAFQMEHAPYVPPMAPTPTYTPPAPPQTVPGWHSPPSRTTALPVARPFPLTASNPQLAISCGVCGSELFAGQLRCRRCSTPPGAIMNPNDPTATAYLPFGPPIALVPIFRVGEEDQTKGANSRISGWNWGAALLPTLWAAKHRVHWFASVSALLSVILACLIFFRVAVYRTPDAGGTLTGLLAASALIFGIPRTLYAGSQGNALAWQSGLYSELAQCTRAQRTWALWAIIGVTVGGVVLLALVAFVSAR